MLKHLLTITLLLIMSLPAYSQNTGGIFGPAVSEGHRSMSYRMAIDPENSAGDLGFAQRLHYQQSVNGDLMIRLVGQTRKTGDSDFDFDYLQAEFFIQLSDDDAPVKFGMRVDTRYRDGDRPEQLGVHFMNGFTFGPEINTRLVLLTSRQFGDNGADGINLQTRVQLAKKLGNGRAVGLEMYNMYGNTGNIGGFGEQSHTIGPYFSASLGNKFSLFANPQFGISESAPDLQMRLFLTRGF